MADDGESLESRLNKATSPSNRQEDWEFILGFCDQVNKELEGPQISVKLLVHKIQSPQEWEAIQALTVLEACMKNCGRRFQSEVGKFRFLNELIKVISPKYEGDAVSEKMKARVITMMYSWTVSLPHEAKICEAYHLLKSQGIVLADPEIPRDATLTAPPLPRPKNPVFDDEKKSKRLAELLKSKKPEDLQEANWLIKNMVKEDKVRTQKAEKQRGTLEAVNNSVKVLSEMLEHFSSEESTDGDKELIMELYGDCDKLRQTVFQLATETEDNDSSLGDILQASDDLSHVINLYKRIVETINGQREKAQQLQSSGTSCTNQSEMLIDLLDMDIKSTSESRPRSLTTSSSPPADLMWGPTASDPRPPNPSASSAALCLLDEELLSLGLSETVPGTSKPTHVNLSECLPSSQESSQDLALFDITSSSVPVCCDVLSASTVSQSKSSSAGAMFSTALVCKESDWAGLALSSVLTTTVPAASPAPPTPVHTSPQPSYTTLLSQNLQDFTLLELSSPTITPQQKTEQDLFTPAPLSFSHCASSNKPTSLLLRGIPGVSTSPPMDSQRDNSLPLHSPSSILHLSCSTPGWEQQASLANVFVPLDAVRPSHECPVTAYDKNGIRVVLHSATDCPGGRADILVMVASIRSTAPLPVRNVVLQAAVPKTMKVRLQQPSGTELAPFNPVLPPASITQVILLANPLKEKVRMRYKLTFTLGEQWYTEVGEVNDFPPVHTGGAL